MPETLDIKTYQQGDETKIIELFNASFTGQSLPLHVWNWRFRDNPAGHGIIHLAWDDAMLAGHYAVSPVQMNIEGKDCFTGLSGTTMTHPDYRGRKLFPLLARHTYQDMMDRGMVMVWGFPNALIHRSRVRELKWRDIYEIPILRLQLTACRSSSQRTSSREILELHDADSRFDDLWGRVHNDYHIIVRRDCAYIKWRYFANPNWKYRLIAQMKHDTILGYAVFKRYQHELQVVDLLTAMDDVTSGEALIDYIIGQALKEDAVSVGLWLNVTHPLHYVLEKKGFKPEGPVTYLGGLALHPRFDDSIYDFHRWYFTMSDSDVF